MTSTSPRAAAIDDLTHIVTSWPALRERLITTTPATWPPLMGIRNMERDEEQLAEAAAEHAERSAVAPGERPAPLHVPILDTIRAIEDDLLDQADTVASAIQRPAFTISSASPHDQRARDIALATARIAETDRTDPRRWRWNLATDRSAPAAAAWLADRLTSTDGPFRPLTLAQQHEIARTAAHCRRWLDDALGEHQADVTELDGLACECGGQLAITNGLADFTVTCRGCGTTWTGTSLLRRLSAA